jgi:zona occludens toxin
MISYYTGIPRSGKTLKAVYEIYFDFIFDGTDMSNKIKKIIGKKEEKKEDKYLYLCTNINQFNFDLSDKFYKLDFQELYKNLKVLYDMYILHKEDDKIIEKAKELKLYKVLFVFDECHNFFKEKKDPILVWWLTYHGHIYHEIILITQGMSLLSKEYKSQGEQFYKAIPQTYRLSKKTFKYSLYSSFHMYKTDFIKSLTITPTKEVFDMYVSGDKVNSKSILHKYIFLFFTLLILCIFSFIYVIDSFSTSTDSENETTAIESSITNKTTIENRKESISVTSFSDDIEENEELLNYKYMKLKCSVKYKYCLYNKKKIQINTYYKLKKIFKIEELSISSIVNGFVQLEILADNKFFNIFNGGQENEKVTNTDNTSLFNTN